MKLGRSYELEVVKELDFGFYLDAENLGEVLLPNRVVPEGTNVGDSLSVFLYLDSEDRPIATTKKPRAQVGQFAYLRAVETTDFGAFLDWGLDKHILLPFAEQHRKIEVGKSYLVYLYLDERDGRIVASSKIDKFIEDKATRYFKTREPVDLIIANTTELGYKAIVNHSCWGVLYKSDVFQKLSFGQRVKGFIRRVRPDGKVDLTLNGGNHSRDRNTKIVLDYLNKNSGFAPLHDKTDPKIISSELGMSKGAFKKAIGNLYKQKVISIDNDGIRMLSDSN